MLPGVLIGALVGAFTTRVLVAFVVMWAVHGHRATKIALLQCSQFLGLFVGGFIAWKLQQTIIDVFRPAGPTTDGAPKKPWGRLISLGAIAVIALSVCGYFAFIFFEMFGGMFGRKEKPQFVRGPEATDIIQKAKGHLLINQGWDSAEPAKPGILDISLPDQKRMIVRKDSPGYLDISRVAGPNKKGLIVFVTSSGMLEDRKARWYKLKTIRIDAHDSLNL